MSKLGQFDAAVAKRIDNAKLPGFGAPQAGMVRCAMEDEFIDQLENGDPIEVAKMFIHMLEVRRETRRQG